ncbi:hypothetical protein MUK42_08460, partial [Musa troglodytarum]
VARPPPHQAQVLPPGRQRRPVQPHLRRRPPHLRVPDHPLLTQPQRPHRRLLRPHRRLRALQGPADHRRHRPPARLPGPQRRPLPGRERRLHPPLRPRRRPPPLEGRHLDLRPLPPPGQLPRLPHHRRQEPPRRRPRPLLPLPADDLLQRRRLDALSFTSYLDAVGDGRLGHCFFLSFIFPGKKKYHNISYVYVHEPSRYCSSIVIMGSNDPAYGRSRVCHASIDFYFP